ncbi:MAG: hypothetical protein WKF89_10215 [Chitinophagaceae bacterium]
MNIPLYYTLKQCDQVTVENITMPYITSLNSCLNRVKGDGYTDSFRQSGKGIQSKKTNRIYLPSEITVVNFFRFEGNTNPDDNVVMYMIETTDGNKGTLVNTYVSSNEPLSGKSFLYEKGIFQ